MTIPRPLAVLSLSAVAAVVGCESTATTTVYTPVTGVQIPTADVVAGYGCGTANTQVFRYAASIAYYVEAGIEDAGTIASAEFPCFADGLFSNLPSPTGGNQPFAITIYAMNLETYGRAFGCDADTCGAADASNIDTWTALANWTTTCQGTQVAGVTALATCTPLQATLQTTSGSSVADAGGDP